MTKNSSWRTKTTMKAKRQEREYMETLEKMRQETQEREREKERQFKLEKLKLQQSDIPLGRASMLSRISRPYLLFKKMMLTSFSYISRNWLLTLIGQKITGLHCCRKLLLERHEKSLLSCQSNSHKSMNMSGMLFSTATN